MEGQTTQLQGTILDTTNKALLEEIVRCGQRYCFEPDEVLLRQGDRATGLYIVLDGIVSVHDDEVEYACLTAGCMAGEYSLIDKKPCSATVTCLETANVIFLPAAEFEDLLSESSSFRTLLFTIFTSRLRELNEKEKGQQKRYAHTEREMQSLIHQSKEIELQQAFILNQGDKISEQNFKITESIQYAKRIQKALLPSKDDIEAIWSEYFILYKPKSIVGGDFYWTKRKGSKLYITAADCTGHGVPGAFMCMLGITALNQIIDDATSEMTAAEILNRLRNNVIETLKQRTEGSTSRDGMDISFCIIDTEHNVMCSAGANNPVYVARNHEIIQLKGDKMPIGRHVRDTVPFNNTVFHLEKDDCIYLFSDGYADQFDTENKYKFGSRRFRELLVKINHLPMVEQKIILTQTIKEWRGLQKQLDDIVVIGLKSWHITE